MGKKQNIRMANSLKWGYTPSRDHDLISEIHLARSAFDFVEITLGPDVNMYSDSFIEEMKSALDGFKVLGHIHWEINLLGQKGIEEACSLIKISKNLGISKVTIHPSASQKFEREELLEKNICSLSEITKFSRKNGIMLLVENTSKEPFNSLETVEELLSGIPGCLATLDIGHTLSVSSPVKFFDVLGSRIKHVHLHDNKDGNDHLFFQDQEKLKNIIKTISEHYEGTVTLEMFSGKERRKLCIEQLEIIKTIC